MNLNQVAKWVFIIGASILAAVILWVVIWLFVLHRPINIVNVIY